MAEQNYDSLEPAQHKDYYRLRTDIHSDAASAIRSMVALGIVPSAQEMVRQSTAVFSFAVVVSAIEGRFLAGDETMPLPRDIVITPAGDKTGLDIIINEDCANFLKTAVELQVGETYGEVLNRGLLFYTSLAEKAFTGYKLSVLTRDGISRELRLLGNV